MIKLLFSIMLVLAVCQVQSQTLIVGTNPESPPFTYVADNGTIVGFDIDFFAAVSKVGGFQYEWVQASWRDLFAAVQNSTVDFAVSGITINSDREKIYDFSVPYFISTHVILAPKGTDITNAQDLVLLNKTVAVRNGTTGQVAVESVFGGDSPNIVPFITTDEAFQALTNGSVDAFVDDSGVLEYLANNNAGFVVIRDSQAFAKEFYGFMFPKGSALVAGINSDITTLLQNGEYATIYKAWFGSTPDVDLLLAAGEDANPYDALNEEAVFGEEGYISSEEGFITELGEMLLLL